MVATGTKGSSRSLFRPKNMRCMAFRAPWLHHAILFFSDVEACHSTFYHFSWGSNECVCDFSTAKIQSRNSLPSCLQHCRWIAVRTTHGSLFIVQHVCNPLCTNFSFPPAVGEDMIHTCWRDSNFCSNCHVWNITDTFNNKFHLWRSSIATVVAALWGASSVSFLPFLMASAHQQTVSYEGTCVPNHSFNNL